MRCEETATDSFFGNFLYDPQVAKDHFTRKLNEIVEWDRFTWKLSAYYKARGRLGNPIPLKQALALLFEGPDGRGAPTNALQAARRHWPDIVVYSSTPRNPLRGPPDVDFGQFACLTF